jgi:ssRNA-specific RNase YbeY (16S rRNA maturation enzyme)
VERVQENAADFKVPLKKIRRVMVHGVLHYCGYKDKGEAEELLMRSKEDENSLFHVEQ